MIPSESMERLIRKLRRSTTVETDERIIRESLAAMRESLAGPVEKVSGWWRTKILAGAVVILVGILAAVFFLEKETEQSQQVVMPGLKKTIKPRDNEIRDAEEKAEAELKKVIAMFAAGDVNGLVTILNEGQFQSKLAATFYLSSIGDMRALEPLERLSKEYGLGDPNNLFAIAADRIKARLAEERAAAEEAEREAAAMVYGVLVDVNGWPVQGEVRFGDSSIETDEQGEFTIDKRQIDADEVYLCLAIDKNKKLGRIFLWDAGSEVNEMEIVVESLAGVAGRLVDANGIAAAGIKVQVEAKGPDGEIYQPEGMIWQGTSDANGMFEIDGIMTGLPMALKIAGEHEKIEAGELEAGQEKYLGDIVIKAGGIKKEAKLEESLLEWNCTLSGVVTDANGAAVRGISVSASVGNKNFEDFTDESGWYHLEGLPRGERIQLKVKTENLENTFDVICDGNDFDIKLGI